MRLSSAKFVFASLIISSILGTTFRVEAQRQRNAIGSFILGFLAGTVAGNLLNNNRGGGRGRGRDRDRGRGGRGGRGRGLGLGGILGGRGRGLFGGKRDTEAVLQAEDDDDILDETELFLSASIEDVDDCVKSYLCQLNAPDVSPDFLTDLDFMIKEAFPTMTRGDDDVCDSISYKSPTVEFDLAALIGSNSDMEHCGKIYARCSIPFPDISLSMKNMFDSVDQNVIKS